MSEPGERQEPAEDVSDPGPFDDGVYAVASLPSGRPVTPAESGAAAVARREIAECLADDLADPPYRLEGLAHDWARAALEVPLSYPPVWRVYQESFAVFEAAKAVPDEVAIFEGYDGTGLVIRAHGPAWSVVLATNGPSTTVYVCCDDIPVPLLVDPVPGDWRERNSLNVWIFTTLAQLQQAALGGTYVPPNASVE